MLEPYFEASIPLTPSASPSLIPSSSPIILEEILSLPQQWIHEVDDFDILLRTASRKRQTLNLACFELIHKILQGSRLYAKCDRNDKSRRFVNDQLIKFNLTIPMPYALHDLDLVGYLTLLWSHKDMIPELTSICNMFPPTQLYFEEAIKIYRLMNMSLREDLDCQVVEL